MTKERCDRCDRPNPVWWAPPELWKRVEIDRGFKGVLCPACFIDDAEAQGVARGTTGWLITTHPRVTPYYEQETT